LALVGLALATAAHAAEVIEKPDWVAIPTGDDVTRVWPVEATRLGVGGAAILDCVVTADGHLSDCKVVKESPDNLGFGAAALALAPQFAMKPTTADGRSAAGASVVIPIKFERPPGDDASGGEVHVIAAPAWSQTPTPQDVAQAQLDYAIGAAAGGGVNLLCRVNPDATLKDCAVHGERPQGKGLAAAAAMLAKDFKLALDPGDTRPTDAMAVDIRFTFPDPSNPAPVQITQPQWTQGPDPSKLQALYPPKAAEAGVRSGRGVVECAVAHSGALTACSVVREEPQGLGFGEAAVQIASVMAMNPWTEDGRPVDGARIRLPVDLQLPAAAADAAPVAGAAKP